MRTLADDALRIRHRMAEVERRDRVKNILQGIGFVSSGSAREPVLAFVALKNLKRLQTVSSLPLSNGVLRMAFRTDGVMLFGLGLVHVKRC